MIFYVLISIVFIAEIIIALALILSLMNLDKKIKAFNDFLEDIKPSIKGLMITVRKISKQLLELSPIVVKQIKSFFTDLIMGQIKSLAGAVTFWLVKKEVEKHV